MYNIPKIDVTVSGLFFSRPGPQLAANQVIPNAVVRQSLGRDLSANAQNVTVNLVNPARCSVSGAISSICDSPSRSPWIECGWAPASSC